MAKRISRARTASAPKADAGGGGGQIGRSVVAAGGGARPADQGGIDRSAAEWAQDDRARQRELEARFGVQPDDKAVFAEAQRAIRKATALDQREIGRNLDIDYEAYEAAQKPLARLVQLGQLPQAMKLAVVLTRRRSYYYIAGSLMGVNLGQGVGNPGRLENCPPPPG